MVEGLLLLMSSGEMIRRRSQVYETQRHGAIEGKNTGFLLSYDLGPEGEGRCGRVQVAILVYLTGLGQEGVDGGDVPRVHG